MTVMDSSSGSWAPQSLFEGAITPADAIVRALIDGGVDLVLGIPGGNCRLVFKALAGHSSEIRTIIPREESLASIMAEAFGKQSARPAVLLAQGAWVTANGAMGMLEALTSSTPLIVITDLTDGGVLSQHAPYQAGTGDYGNWDLRRSLEGITKLTTTAASPAQAVQAVQRAIQVCASGQPGPVAVILESGALVGMVSADGLPQLYSSRHYTHQDARPADRADIHAAAQHLVGAQSPVIVSGNGVRMGRASAELLALAERLGAPVVSTAGGKGSIPERHPLALGMMGPFGLEAANVAVSLADVVLAVGTKLAPTDTCGATPTLLDPRRQHLLQIDIEPRNAAWTFPSEPLLGDAAATLSELLRACGPAEPDRYEQGVKRVLEANRHGSFESEDSIADSVPIPAQRLVAELSRRLPANAVVTCDAGENRLFMAHHYRTGSANGFIQAGGIGGMGYAIPAAMGAKLAEPERLCVAVCGDGGFSMAMNGLMTSVEKRIPIAVVVMNNGMLGWVAHDNGEGIDTGFRDFDHAEIARALGCDGYVARTPHELASSLDAAVARPNSTSVIDVRISPDSTFRSCASSFASSQWSALVQWNALE
jgi:acetolactate synthase I/II/III large subunit